MAHWTKSLSTKLTASFIILILVISGLTVFVTYGSTKEALKQSIREDLMSVSGVIATQVNTTTLQALKPGDEGNADYRSIVDSLVKMRSMNTHIINTYIISVDPDSSLRFLVDDAYALEPNDIGFIGDVYSTSDSPQIIAALKGPTASSEFYTDKWGTFMSGYAPIRDSSNNTIAILGVDMRADAVIQRQNYIGYTIFLIILLSVIIAAGVVLFFSRTIIRDIKKLNHGADRISHGETDVIIDVRRSDEIGELADSFSRMVASLKIMMGLGEEKK